MFSFCPQAEVTSWINFRNSKFCFVFVNLPARLGTWRPVLCTNFKFPSSGRRISCFHLQMFAKTNISRWWLWMYKTIVKIGGEYLNPHWMEMMKTMVRFGGVDVIWWGITLSDRSWVTTSPDAKASPSQRQRWWWRWLCQWWPWWWWWLCWKGSKITVSLCGAENSHALSV